MGGLKAAQRLVNRHRLSLPSRSGANHGMDQVFPSLIERVTARQGTLKQDKDASSHGGDIYDAVLDLE